MTMLFDDESGYPSLAEAVEALRMVIGVTREQIDRLDRERKALEGLGNLGAPAGPSSVDDAQGWRCPLLLPAFRARPLTGLAC
jgi:hypothetical protein